VMLSSAVMIIFVSILAGGYVLANSIK